MKYFLVLFSLLLSVTCLCENMGWRNDGTGVYKSVTPPVKWSKNDNVIWKTSTENCSNATPIIVGDKIFICEERFKLLCLNLKDGKLLWRKDNTFLSTLPQSELAKAQKEKAKGDEINKRLSKVNTELNNVRKKLRKDKNNKSLNADRTRLEKEVGKIKKELAPYHKYLCPKAHGVNGYSTPTPVSDGKHVYTIFGNGLVVCYDLNGNRKWAISVDHPKNAWGLSASPLIADNKLIIHSDDIMAFDLSSGKKVWEKSSKASWGTPVKTNIGGKDIVLLANGEMYAAADGTKVIDHPLRKLQYNAPVVIGDTVYYSQDRSYAYKLSLAGEKIKADKIWENRIKKDRYYSSPAIAGGLLYTITRNNELTVQDSTTGKVHYTKKIDVGKGTIYSSIAIAGDKVYITNDNGTTLVLELGKTYKEVAKNKLDVIRSCPIFAGSKLYIRTYKYLYCIGK